VFAIEDSALILPDRVCLDTSLVVARSSKHSRYTPPARDSSTGWSRPT
jgi:hypothetical protein